MRIWSLHPSYLDAKGLVALWREALLAKNVLEEKTKGYRHHPQLLRFRKSIEPLPAINLYLARVYDEAVVRGYKFDRGKVLWECIPCELVVTTGQLEFEREHLLKKLFIRDTSLFQKYKKEKKFRPHPIFKVIEGEVEDWEIISGG